MAKSYDIVIAGGGHNGLLAGAYLAKAGLSVCVVEKQDWVGGGAVTRELTGLPGFKHDECSIGHMLIQPNPLIANDELGLLSKFGLKYLFPQAASTVIFPDDTYLAFYMDVDKTCEQIAKFSQKDADTFRKFSAFVDQTYDILAMGATNPPAPFSTVASMLEESELGREILRALNVSAWDVAEEWFESDEMKIAVTRVVSEGMLAPQTKGTGYMVFFYFSTVHRFGLCLPEGGSGEISEALRRCFESMGGVVKTGSLIKDFKISGGECTGLVLEDGEEILAKKAVVSSMSIKQVPEMVPTEMLPDDYVAQIKRAQYSDFFPFHIELALNEAPKFKAPMNDIEASFVEFSPKDKYEFLQTFNDLMLGIPRGDIPLLITPTVFDKTRAPNGKHCLYDYNYAPYTLREGGAERWDDIKEEYIEKNLQFLQSRCVNMGPDNILGRWAFSPLDLARHNPSFKNGDFAHIGLFTYQAFGNRPVPLWNYRTPVKKLYICGASTHPGHSVNGAARAAMPVIMEDLGIDFEDVIG